MDIYFTKKYGELCEEIEGGISEIFRFESNNGDIHHMFIKRPINQVIDGVQYYDLITPYGYGGPLMMARSKERKKELCNEFEYSFMKYCIDNHIVSEFVRFHPIINNAQDFANIYHPVFTRKTLGTNLADYEDPVQSEFSKSCRKNIRRALRKGITYRITEKPDNIDQFIHIYYSTMKRNNATEFYYFDKAYFDNILLLKNNLLFVEVIYEEKTIAAGLYFISEGMIHIHLSGTLSEYLYLSPAYILRYATTLWGKENGYKIIHHGGGTSNEVDNSLYLFKKQFAKNTEFNFYVGKKIWNQIIYNKLCQLSKVDQDLEFFPAYRFNK